MRRHLTASLLLYSLADVALTLLSISYFAAKSDLVPSRVVDYISFNIPYGFTTSPFEFLVLFIMRQVLLTIGSILTAAHKDNIVKGLTSFVFGFAICSYSFSLVKFLAFSENAELLYWKGLWMIIGWTIVSSFLLAVLWYLVLTHHEISYRQLINTPNQLIEDNAEDPLVSRTATLDESQESSEQPRMSLFKHVIRLLSYCGLYWKWFFAGFIFLTGYALARVFIPSYMAKVITDIVDKRGFSSLIKSITIMGLLSLMSTLFGGLRGGSFDYATALVSRRVRLDLFSSLVNQDIGFFDTTKTGATMSRLTADCQTISSTVSTNLNVFLRNGVMLIGALVFMFAMSWRLAMVTFIAIPLVGFVTKLYSSYYDKISERMQETITHANQMAEEVLSTMRTVRSFACERREVFRFKNHLNTTLNVNKKKAIAYLGYTWMNEFCENAILVSVLFYGGHLVMTDKMSKEQLITFLLYQLQLGENLYNLSYVISGLMEAVGASRKVFELMNRTPTFALDGNKMPTVNGMITFDDVSFTYPSRPNNQVLKNLSLQLQAGETIALVGPSGGGKSSIVSLIEHFYEPNSGDILLDGVSIRDINHVYYHQKIALVAQEPVLYEGSVRHNILYGCDFATEDDMLNASKLANVHDFVMELEKGYDTNCGEKGVQMSGGQKQRIAIARALVRNPAVLILDEATSALDAESEALVQQALSRCAKERTVIIIAHRLSTIEKADKIVVICKGKVQQIGKHTDLMNDQNGIYYSLVNRQLLAAKVEE